MTESKRFLIVSAKNDDEQKLSEQLSKKILIDFFATIGLPKNFMIKQIKHI